MVDNLTAEIKAKDAKVVELPLLPRRDTLVFPKLLSQLMGSERKVADVVMDRPANANYRPSPTDFARLDNVPREGGYSGGRGSDPFAGFFGRIFR